MTGEPDLDHHGDVEARGAKLDFAVNVVPGPPWFITQAMQVALVDVAAYPDEGPTRRLLAARLGVDPEAVLLVNGVAEAFTLIARLAAWRQPVVVHPQFTEPEAALRVAGHLPERLVLSAPDWGDAADRGDAVDAFTLTPAAIADPVLEGADLVVVGNPTNPTSRLHEARAVSALRGRGATGTSLLVVDEAFMDVVGDESESLQVAAATTPGLVVLRSLTKTFALAGIRAGYVVGEPALIGRLRAQQPPWSVNSVALGAVRASLTAEAEEYVASVVARLDRWRPYEEAGLTERGWQVVPRGRAPFMLARHPHAARIREELRSEGIAVRRGDTFPGLGNDWARFALRPPSACDQLFDALDRISSP
ncbi:MAG: Rv2231c family pyridoxal phosphate-dependent protein CobC [Dermatophilus congolensis]|nr:Rv2231c family pyridoxal phosphate-dependent protein CobC [Dermatophilus congolensis]